VPASVRISAWLLWGVIALNGLTALLTVVLREDLVRSWAEGNEGEEATPAFVPVAIVLFVVLALLGWMLVVFFCNGHGWARWSIAALVVFIGFSAVVGLNRNLPTPFLVLTSVSLVLYAALLVFLFHKDTNAFLKRV